MDRKTLGIRLVGLIVFIFILNHLTNLFYWDVSIWWIDMLLHFMGGLWIGLAAFWFLSAQELSLSLILKVILAVLVVGVGWEVYEIIVSESLSGLPLHTLDSVSDIFFDLAGGTFAILYFFRRIRYNLGNAR